MKRVCHLQFAVDALSANKESQTLEPCHQIARPHNYHLDRARRSCGRLTMATPTPMKSVASQQGQGRTPQFSAGSPPVSTPFSLNQHAAFSPRGPRSSPQHVKKSPAPGLAGHGANGPLNFDSPSAAAAMGALGIAGGLDIGLDTVGVGGLGGLQGLGVMGGEDERLKRLDAVIEILSVRCSTAALCILLMVC